MTEPTTSFDAYEFDPESEAFAERFDELSLWSARFGSLLLDNVPIAKHLRVVDLGCGTGFPTIEFAQRLGPTATVIGVDIWPAAVERARGKLAAYGVANATVVRASAEALPFPDGYFDLAVSNLGINNFDDAARAMSECARVLKQGGRVAITTNLVGHMRELYDALRETLEEQVENANVTTAIDELVRHIDHRQTLSSAKALLETVGLRVTNVVEDSFRMRFADADALFAHWLIRVGFLRQWREIVRALDVRRILEAVAEKLERRAAAEREGTIALSVPMLYVEGMKRNR